MAKRPTKQPPRRTRSWAGYHIKGTAAKLVGIVHDRPDERRSRSAGAGERARPADGAAAALIEPGTTKG